MTKQRKLLPLCARLPLLCLPPRAPSQLSVHQHNGASAGLALAPDGLRVVVGTSGGALSLLDLSSRAYSTLLRSHTAAVHCVAPLLPELPGEGRYVTAGADGTVRVWDGANHQQVVELAAPGEAVLR